MKNMLGLANVPEEFRSKPKLENSFKRHLAESTVSIPKTSNIFDGTCKYCLSEQDLIAYLKGVYDG